MSTRVEGGTVLIMITAHATLSAGPVHLSLSAGRTRYREPGATTSPTPPTSAPTTGASPGSAAATWTHSATPPASARPATSSERTREAYWSSSPRPASTSARTCGATMSSDQGRGSVRTGFACLVGAARERESRAGR